MHLVDRKKAENVGENSPKIQGGPQYDQFRNLSSVMDSASRDTIFPPKSLRGREIMGQNFESRDTKISP